jgi:tRNA1Val (adenine37-N6)-methyltransferase
MKVSTDACIQGAWTPLAPHVQRVLDIGAGTGLLSLMLAQRNDAITIEALEIDAQAAQQAATNFIESPWAERLSLTQTDAKSFIALEKYDLIICNPPFFSNSLLGPHAARNVARHNLLFTLEDLVIVIKTSLNENGAASVLLPAMAQIGFEKLLMQYEFSITQKLLIYPSTQKPANRVVTIFQKEKKPMLQENLYIRDAENVYSKAFQQLMQPYYLHY